jgi:hypothetical protein
MNDDGEVWDEIAMDGIVNDDVQGPDVPEAVDSLLELQADVDSSSRSSHLHSASQLNALADASESICIHASTKTDFNVNFALRELPHHNFQNRFSEGGRPTFETWHQHA